MNKNKRAVIYCRVSTKEQVEEGNSLITQERTCREFAIKHGYEIAEVFIEQGESAKTSNRTQLQNLLTYCSLKKNQVNAVIAYKIDRISRNMDDYSYLRIFFKKHGIEIKSTSEYFENTPVGRFMENIIANVSQFDNDVRTERSVGGMREAMREGRYVWKAPIGYKNSKVAGKTNLIIVPKLASVIMEVFNQVANKTPIEWVRQFSAKNGLTQKCGKTLAKSHFYRLLQCEIYVGWIKKFGERHKGIFEPIISQELFDEVQSVLKRRVRRIGPINKENQDFPLRRFISHSTGIKLSGYWSKNRYGYYKYPIKGHNYKKEVIEEKFKAFMNLYKFDETRLNKLEQSIKDNLIKKTKEKLKEAKRIEAFIEELKNERSGIIKKNIQQVLNDSTAREEINRIESSIFQSQQTLSKIPQVKYELENVLTYLKEYLKNPALIWERSDFATKTALQQFEFPQGIIFDGVNFRTQEISCIFKLNSEELSKNSPIVHYKDVTSNFNNLTQKAKIPKEVYWDNIGRNLINLNKILQSDILRKNLE